MNVKLTKAQKIRILNSDDLYNIMQHILLRENKIDRDREHLWVTGLAGNGVEIKCIIEKDANKSQ